VTVQRDLLLGDVPERFRARHELRLLLALRAVVGVERPEARVEVLRDLRDVALEEVHERGLGFVVEIVARQELVRTELVGVLLQQVPAEHPQYAHAAIPSGSSSTTSSISTPNSSA